MKQRAWQKGAVPCSFWVLSEEIILSKRSVSLESCKSADLVKKKIPSAVANTPCDSSACMWHPGNALP